MTNFQAEQLTSPKWLTPERSVSLFPAIIGVFVSIFVVSFVFIPLVFGVRERWDDVLLMETQVNELSLLRRQLNAHEAKLRLIRYQQSLLFALVASKDELKTYLAQLNGLISIYNLSLIELKPELVESYLPPASKDSESSLDSSNTAPLDSDSNILSQDPLLVSGIEKHGMNLVVEGDFVNLLGFLRDLESLSVIMIPSQLNLVQASMNPSEPPSALSLLRMTLFLTGYGRSPS